MADILHVEILLLNTSLKEAQTKWIVQNYPQRVDAAETVAFTVAIHDLLLGLNQNHHSDHIFSLG